MNTITKRTVSGVVYVAVMICSLLLGQVWFGVVCAALMITGILEFAKMTGRNLSHPRSFLVTVEDMIGGLMLMSVGFITYSFHGAVIPQLEAESPMFLRIATAGLPIWILMFLIRCISELYTKHENPLKELSISVFMQIYLGIGLGSMLAMAVKPMLVLLIFIVIWSNDTGAYLVGCSLGRHRMFERVSPKKSWEGFFGGLVIACGMALLFAWAFINADIFINGSWVTILLLSVIAVVFGTWGDLIESIIKRSLHIKDSGNIIPGHGGILDRIDSLLLAVPAVLMFCLITDIRTL